MNVWFVGFGFVTFVLTVAFAEYLENPAAFRGLLAFADGEPLYTDETNDLKGRMVLGEGRWGKTMVEIVRNGANHDWVYVKVPTGLRSYRVEPVFGLTPLNFVYADTRHPETSDFILLEERRDPHKELNLENYVLAQQSKHLGDDVNSAEDDRLDFLAGAKLGERYLQAQKQNKREN